MPNKARNLKLFVKMLRRHCDMDRPEARLASAVLEQAANDLFGGSDAKPFDARNFLLSSRRTPWCYHAGIHPDMLREMVRTYLLKESRTRALRALRDDYGSPR